jgi:hypothetical protein
MQFDFNRILEKFTDSLKEWDTWRGFRNICLLGFLLITAIDLSVARTINSIFQPPSEYRPILLVLSYIVPLVIYLAFFLVKRLYLKIFFSQKINVVFAYNLESLGYESFLAKYNQLINEIRNQINVHNLGNKIKVVICPPDVKLKENTAAEAKTQLGLLGSTLLVWGYVAGSSKTYKFNTQFSYEFGYSRHIKKEDAKKSFSAFIQRILERGLFSSVKMNLENFNDQLLPTIYFILGASAFSLRIIDRAEILFQSFMKSYNDETNILRKRDLGPALVEVNEFLVAIYLSKMGKLFYERDKKIDLLKDVADKIVAIDRANYDANLMLAFCHAEAGDFNRAEDYTRISESNSRRNQHGHLFNNAYFSLLKKEYSRAVSEYSLIPDSPAVLIPQITEYLGERYDATADPAMQFAYGFVNLKWGDKKEGVKYLRKFVKKQSNTPAYIALVQEANKTLGY